MDGESWGLDAGVIGKMNVLLDLDALDDGKSWFGEPWIEPDSLLPNKAMRIYSKSPITTFHLLIK
jgi:hypothetical protein